MESDSHFLRGRRSALKVAGAAGVSLFLPACERAGPPESPPARTGDFADGALRLDLRQRIAAGVEEFTLEGLRLERTWPGRRDKLADGPDWGDYRLSIYYQADRPELLFRQGFDTGLAPDARTATTQLSVRFPMPRRPVRATIEKRRGESAFQAVSTFAIDPAGDAVDRRAAAAMRVVALLQNGEPRAKADIAMLGDGYRESEHAKFAADAARAADYLFSVEPFKTRRGDFNVRAVFTPSAETGATDPYLGLQKKTAFGCAYGTAAAERTLATGDGHALREAASAVPYDFLLVLANARRYGGSAYFGGPAVVAIDSAAARYLVVHEFAHAMAGLADEYYLPAGDGPAYRGNIEPWQPNATLALEREKWRDLLSGPPRPTPWNKTEYERRFADYVRRYERLRASGADEAVVEKLMQDERARQATLLAREPRQAGYFEGANGYAKGMYRSGADCIMFSLQSDYFCAACTAALNLAIDQQTRD